MFEINSTEEAYLLKLEDYLKTDFHDWMIFQTLLYSLLPFHSNITSVGSSKMNHSRIRLIKKISVSVHVSNPATYNSVKL